MTNPFGHALQQEYISNPDVDQKSPFDSPFGRSLADKSHQDSLEGEQEGFWKSSLRTLMQPVQGFLETTNPGLAASFWQLFAGGELEPDIEEWHKLRETWEREKGEPFPEEAFEEAKSNVLSAIPTVRNLASKIEEKFGIPLEPKTRAQKGLRFFTEATRLSPEGFMLRPLNVGLPKPVLGAGIEATREVLKEAGVPEPFDEMLAFGILKQPSEGAPSISIGKKTKPSGLSERKFEDISKPTEVSEKKIKQIESNVESDFRKIADDIIASSPIEKTSTEMKTNPAFKLETAEAFREVESLAEGLTKSVDSEVFKKDLIDKFLKKKGTGFAPGEYDKDYKKFIVNFLSGTPKGKITPSDLVIQYRKNNKELSGAFDPSKSRNYNDAKRDALLDYNRSIADMIEKQYPDTEFSRLFKETNEKWKAINDVEKVDSFVDALFDQGIKYGKGRTFFDKNNQFIFKRALGKEYPKFEQLMKDVLSSEIPYKMLRKAADRGFSDLVESAGAYILHPKVGMAKTAYTAGKKAYKFLLNSVLDKPKLTIKWHDGIQNLKKGDFAAAEKDFAFLKPQVEKEASKESVKAAKEPVTLETKSAKLDKNKKFTTEVQEDRSWPSSKGGVYVVKNVDNKPVGHLEYSILNEGRAEYLNSNPGIYIEHIHSTQPGAAKEAFVEFYKNHKDKDIFITPTTEKGSKALEKELGIKLSPRLRKGGTFKEMTARPRIDYKLTDSDKKIIEGYLKSVKQ